MYSTMTLEEKKQLLADMIRQLSEEECGCLLDELRMYRNEASEKNCDSRGGAGD